MNEKMIAACEIVARIMNVDPAGLMTAASESQMIRSQINQSVFNFGYRWDAESKTFTHRVSVHLQRAVKGLVDDE